MGDDANENTLVLNPVEATIQDLDDLLVDAATDQIVEKKQIQHTPKEIIPTTITSVNSDLKGWYNKKYLGGYRQKISLVEYFNAESQTPTPQEIRNQKVLKIY